MAVLDTSAFHEFDRFRMADWAKVTGADPAARAVLFFHQRHGLLHERQRFAGSLVVRRVSAIAMSVRPWW